MGIEEMFRDFKLGSYCLEYLRSIESRNYNDLNQAISEAIDLLTSEDIIGWFTHHLQAQEYEPMLSFKELKERYGRDVQKWLLSGFFPEGSFNIIDAAGGVGKTRLAYDFAWHFLIGTPWNGLPVTNLQDRRILIVQADENPQDTNGSLGEKLSDNEENPNIKFKTRWRINQIPLFKKEIKAKIRTGKEYV